MTNPQNVNPWTPWRQSYVSEFLSLRCAGDVLNIVNPLGTKTHKEITESMAVIRRLRSFALHHPMEYMLVDLCAGNALTSVTAIHLLPFRWAVALDKRPRKRRWEAVNRFDYVINDIGVLPFIKPEHNPLRHVYEKSESSGIILCCVHGCGDLAVSVVDLYKQSPEVKGLVLMPCCRGTCPVKVDPTIAAILGKYRTWAYSLARYAGGNLFFDEKCLSPCNGVIVAEKSHG
jgi:hypothetical protein